MQDTDRQGSSVVDTLDHGPQYTDLEGPGRGQTCEGISALHYGIQMACNPIPSTPMGMYVQEVPT